MKESAKRRVGLPTGIVSVLAPLLYARAAAGALARLVPACAFALLALNSSAASVERIAGNSAPGGAVGGDYVNRIVNDDGSIEYAHVFTNTAPSSLIVSSTRVIAGSGRVLLVGGGGAGHGNCGGGGGAGGLLLGPVYLETGIYAIDVGAGGTCPVHDVDGENTANDGEDTTIAYGGDILYTAFGGGRGAGYPSMAANPGGSGGGGGGAGGASTQADGYGNAGGDGGSSRGGGGGGAGGAGGNGSSSGGGAGGAGMELDFSGESAWYAAGGGGGTASGGDPAGTGGSGIGGDGSGLKGQNATDGAAGTGSGGGGGAGGGTGSKGGSGGSGIVVVRYMLNDSDVDPMEDGTTNYIFRANGVLTLERAALARILAVGGGGAGGSGYQADNNLGGGAGGGAGGFIDATNMLSIGRHTVEVGAGGEAPDYVLVGDTTPQTAGGNGGDSVVSIGGVTNVWARGGGGGGIGAVSANGGGSGGGGSLGGSSAGGAAQADGSAEDWLSGGLGKAGGIGNTNQAGAGGGGAGGLGGDSGPARGAGGAGGAGLPSDISCHEGDAPVWYAGGGGGGSFRASGGSAGQGGLGGGGTGAGQAAAAYDGEDGTGGGGGGGSNAYAGGAGGSGIVIIRVIRFMPERPADGVFTADGSEHAICEGDEAYTIRRYETAAARSADTAGTGGEIVGTAAGTVAGEYYYKVVLNPLPGGSSYTWADGGRDAVDITLTINKDELAVLKFSQSGWQLGTTPPPPVFEASYPVVPEFRYCTYPGKVDMGDDPASLGVGRYIVKALVPDSGTDYTIPEGATYETDPFEVWNFAETPGALQELGRHATVAVPGLGSAVSNLPLRVEISENSPSGFHYANAAVDGSDLRFSRAVPAPGGGYTVEVLAHEITKWNPGGKSVVWVNIPAYEDGQDGKIVMNWGELEDVDLPDVPGFDAWDGTTAPLGVGLDDYARHADFVITYEGAQVTNFPMRLKISENSPNGFSYSQAATADDVRFSWYNEETGASESLPYECERWNAEGESVFWVKVPRYAKGEVISLNWSPRSGRTIAPNDPAGVWSDYAGVWHFDEEIDGESAADASSADASGNGFAAVPTRLEDKGDLSVMVSAQGIFGNARVNGVYGGNSGVDDYTWLGVPGFDQSRLGGTFTFSGWLWMTQAMGYPSIITTKATKESGANPPPGDGFDIAVNNPRWSVRVCGGGSTAAAGTLIPSKSGSILSTTKAAFVHLTVVYDGATAKVYAHSATFGDCESETPLAINAPTVSTADLAFGGNAAGARSFWGLFDEFRLRSGAVDAAWAAAEYAQGATVPVYTTTGTGATGVAESGETMTDSGVVFKNHWIVDPAPADIVIAPGDESPVYGLGQPAYGASYLQAYSGARVLDPGVVPTEPGEYTVLIRVDAGTDGSVSWGALASRQAKLVIRVSSPACDLAGDAASATAAGRVLLANDDSYTNGDKAKPVSGQSYWQTNGTERAETEGIFWTHEEGDFSRIAYLPNLHAGTKNTLQLAAPIRSLSDSAVVWRLTDVRIGNIYPSSLANEPQKNHLPVSSSALASFTASRYGSVLSTSERKQEAAHLVMRNVANAEILSPCYADGIGTIYFDAVNGWTSASGAGYEIAVEFSTNCVKSADLPTDENLTTVHDVYDPNQPYDEETQEPNGTALLFDSNTAEWHSLTLHPLKREGTSGFLAQQPVKELPLAVSGGGSDANFYRIYVPVQEELGGYRGPIRFRIVRRKSVYEHELGTDLFETDTGGLILVDNIQVSYPSTRADMEPMGYRDPSRTGRATIGWGGALSVPFPSEGDTGLLARGRPMYSTNVFSNVIAEDIVTSASFVYRWRYLSQVTSDAISGKIVELGENRGWRSSIMDQGDDGVYRSVAGDELRYPAIAGDLEFFYLLQLNAPYYDYMDYSGINGSDGRRLCLRLVGGETAYTEEITTVTNRAVNVLGEAAVSKFESLGKDWFVRLREGSSLEESFRIVVTNLSEYGQTWRTRTYDMDIVGDDVWRFCLPVNTNMTKGIGFRVEAINAQTPDAAEYAFNTNLWYTAVPVSLGAPVELSRGGAEDYSSVANTAMPGYLIFRVERSKTAVVATVSQGDYQNFGTWDDATYGEVTGGVFVGSSKSRYLRRGVSHDKQTIVQDFESGWRNMPATDGNYVMPDTSWSMNDDYTFSGRTAYEDFSEDTSGAWHIGPGMWVCREYRDKSAVALQMEGCGKGYAIYADSSNAPRGLGTVHFGARLAQPIAFDYFSYYDGENKRKMTNYMFSVKAAFDTKGCDGFTGNAALSTVAYYTPNLGAYELRVEIGTAKANGSFKASGQKLALYRWQVDPGTGKKVAKLLYETIPGAYFDFNLPNAEDEDGPYLPMYLSVSNGVDATFLSAGICRTGKMASLDVTSASGAEHLCLYYRDDSSDRLTYGSYGVLSSNCEGVFLQPTRFLGTIPVSASVANGSSQSDRAQQQAQTYPSEHVDGRVDIKSDTRDPDNMWVCIPGRMGSFNLDGMQWGLRATPTPQTIEIEATDSRTQQWGTGTVRTVEVSAFGNFETNISYYTTQDCAVRFRAGGEAGETRTDVVLYDVALQHWRGADWDDTAYVNSTYVDNYSGSTSTQWITNFTFNTAWITNATGEDAAIMLSAKRTAPGGLAAIRGPLLDGYSFENGTRRGLGLGMMGFDYELAGESGANTNVVLWLQIATNTVTGSANSWESQFIRIQSGWSGWETVAEFAFTNMPPRGTVSHYLGFHDVQGAFRLVMSTNLVNEVADETDPASFGEIFITKMVCRDEPALDDSCWWGWNMRNAGGDADSEKRMYLPDYGDSEELGKSLVLNDSVKNDIIEDDAAVYRANLPFVQTPVFRDASVGEIAFRARTYVYTENDTAYAGNRAELNTRPAYVSLYGSVDGRDGSDGGKWHLIETFVVSNSIYTSCSKRFGTDSGYRSFRLAVTGVEDADAKGFEENPIPEGGAVRVLIDEIVLSAAVYPRMAFRNVGAFRSDMTGEGVVPDCPGRTEQPLFGEAWGVQCEIYPAQLVSEIDESRDAVVRVYWHKGYSPWGWKAWVTNAVTSGEYAELCKVDGTNVFRSSYSMNPDSVLPIMREGGTDLVQYVLSVEYFQKNGEVKTDWLDIEGGEWSTPEWYRPLDLNAQYGKNSNRSAYSIFDTVAPGWAWINEVNLFSEFTRTWDNADEKYQYIEVAHPITGLDGWKVRLVSQLGDDSLVTNTLAVFGTTIPKTTNNAKQVDSDGSGQVFRVIACPDPTNALSKADGTLDMSWNIPADERTGTGIPSSGYMSCYYPIGAQLIRRSGIVEHEIVFEGTNLWGNSANYSTEYHPTNFVAFANAHTSPGANGGFFFAGTDDAGPSCSLSVVTNRGEFAASWTNTVERTPGRKNVGQVIEGRNPSANGEFIVIYADLEGSDIWQTLEENGELITTNESRVVYFRKGDSNGYDIVYDVSKWHELGLLSTNDTALSREQIAALRDAADIYRYTFNVGAGSSNDVRVVASAQMAEDLAARYGLTDDNAYTPAVLDWLVKGRTLRGSFADNDSGNIYLADFMPLHNSSAAKQLTLTEMYWLDLDPTLKWEDPNADHGTTNAVAFRAGMGNAPVTHMAGYESYNGAEELTNVIMGVKLMLTNRVDGSVWAPYMLRGLGPDETSLSYTSRGEQNWTSVTFKVTGILANGLTTPSVQRFWVPMRYFVFTGDEFGNSTSFDDDFMTTVEVRDPASRANSAAYNAGWYQWMQENGQVPVFYSWSLDTRLAPTSVEALCPTNLYQTTTGGN